MDQDFKSEVEEIVALVKTFPENLQLRGFELLLQDCCERHHKPKRQGGAERRPEEPADDHSKPSDGARERSAGPPIELPMRLKAFLRKHQLSTDQLGKLFHIENNAVEPIWNLAATKIAAAQIEIALMEALKHALEAGEFSFDPEQVRAHCEVRRTYDKTNFKANFRNNARLFTAIKEAGPIGLSDEGMNKLAGLIRSKSGSE